MSCLNDKQAKTWGKRFLAAQAQWKPNKLHVMNGQGFRVWGVPEDRKVIQQKLTRLQREEILQRLLIDYVNGKTSIRFTIQRSGPWDIELEVTNKKQINFWVAYAKKDESIKTSQVHITNGRIFQDIKLNKTIEQYIISVQRGLILQHIIV